MKNEQWRLAVNIAGFLGVVLIDRTKLLPTSVVAVFMDKINDSHPQMRSIAQGRMMLVNYVCCHLLTFSTSVCCQIWVSHDVKKIFILERHIFQMKSSSDLPKTNVLPRYILRNSIHHQIQGNRLLMKAHKSSIFHDQIKTGMFVWPSEFMGYKTPARSSNLDYSSEVLEQLKALAPKFNRTWVHQQLEYLREETSKSGSGLRSPEAYIWPLLFRVFRGLDGAVTEEEIRQEITGLLGDGKDKFRHQATFEVIFSLIMSLKFAPQEYVQRTWDWLLPLLLKIFETMLKPDNVGFWRTFLTSIIV